MDMGEMTRDEILRGLQGYEREMRTILRVLRRRPFTQDEFDQAMSPARIFAAESRRKAKSIRNRRNRYQAYRPDQFILGSMHGRSVWHITLDLMQHMMAADMVATHRNEHDRIVYTLGERA